MFVYLPSEETGRLRKLPQPLHDPYNIVTKDNQDVTVTQMYFPDYPSVHIHD